MADASGDIETKYSCEHGCSLIVTQNGRFCAYIKWIFIDRKVGTLF